MYYLVAGPRIALGPQGYEPCMQLLHLPADCITSSTLVKIE